MTQTAPEHPRPVVMPGLTRHPEPTNWIPAFAGMT
jgi:hypothetical protein